MTDNTERGLDPNPNPNLDDLVVADVTTMYDSRAINAAFQFAHKTFFSTTSATKVTRTDDNVTDFN